MPTPEFILELRRHVGHAPLFLMGVTAIVLRTDEGRTRVLLVRRSDTGEWTPIGGIVEPGEQVHEVAVREVAEETTVTAELVRLAWVSTGDRITYPNGDVTEYVDHTFELCWVRGEPRPGDEESTEAGWFDVDDLPPLRPVFVDRITEVLERRPGVRFGHEGLRLNTP